MYYLVIIDPSCPSPPHPAKVAKCNEMQEFVFKVLIQDDLKFKYKKIIGLLNAIRSAIDFPLL